MNVRKHVSIQQSSLMNNSYTANSKKKTQKNSEMKWQSEFKQRGILSVIVNGCVENSNETSGKDWKGKKKNSCGVVEKCEEGDKDLYGFQEFSLGWAPRS